MKVPVDTVAAMVKEASAKMSDPSYSQVMVGGFVQEQPTVARYISAHAGELGGAEGVINTIFHAALLGKRLQKANNRSVRQISFDELDHVASQDREVVLGKVQPALLEYIHANVERAEMKRVLMLIVLAMDWVS